MSIKQIGQTIGKQAMLQTDNLQVLVTLIDARVVFNRSDYQIKPVNGTGQTWVSANRITLIES